MRSLKFRNRRRNSRKSRRRRMRGGVPTANLCSNCGLFTYMCEGGNCECSECGRLYNPSVSDPYDGDPGKKNLAIVLREEQAAAARQAVLDGPNPYSGIPGISLPGLPRWGHHK